MKGLKLACAVAGGLSVSASTAQSKGETRPNIIVINCDDLGYGDLACFGHPTIKTPNLDRMAAEGQKWSSFYVSASVSSPSRSGLMTGRLGVRTGMYGDRRRVLFPDSPAGLPSDELTIAELLKRGGYNTGCIGKWHLGHLPESMPLRHGFDYFYGYPYSNDMSRVENAKRGNTNYKFEYVLYEQDKVIATEPPQTELTQQVTAAAVGFIKSNTDSPFFLYVAHPMPHIPIYASADFVGRSARGDYGDTIEELDWSVGRIMETLRQEGLEGNTLVVFTSDNGPWLTQHQRGGSAGPLEDGKGSTFEGGFRVPCIMWGSMVSPGHITDMGGTLDLLPTFCDMAGVPLPADRVYDGVSLLDVIRDKSPSGREAFYFYRGSDLFAMRSGQYKIHFIYQPAYGRDPKKVLDAPRLYDLGVDPSEIYDIAAGHPEIVERLTAMAREHRGSFTVAESVFDK